MAKRTGAKPRVGKPGKRAYIPDAGELIWLNFSPQAGHEQAGRRPALVLSPHVYNSKAGLCLVCPVTHQAKGYPFEVVLPAGLTVGGVVLSDHVKSADWNVRNATFAAMAPSEVFNEVRSKLGSLLGML